MTFFRLLLGIFFLVMSAYTVVTISNEGPNLLPAAISGVQAMGWQGQFNVDFSMFVVLLGLWIAWRHHFTPGGIALAFCIGLGMIFFAAYLLYLSYQTNGDVVEMLIGSERAKARL